MTAKPTPNVATPATSRPSSGVTTATVASSSDLTTDSDIDQSEPKLELEDPRATSTIGLPSPAHDALAVASVTTNAFSAFNLAASPWWLIGFLLGLAGITVWMILGHRR